MQNIYLTKYHLTPLPISATITNICFNQLDNSFYLCESNNTIHHLEYDNNTQEIKVKEVIEADPELEGMRAVDVVFLVDAEALSVVTAEGSIFKVTLKETELVAQNEDGIETASWSPSQDRLLLITKNNTILQLNSQFNLDNQLPLNDSVEEGLYNNARISWKPDGKFCAINFGVKDTEARKCLIRDNVLNVFKSAAKPDADPKDPVQSVSENPVAGLKESVAWQPNGNIIAGVITSQKGGYKVAFWEKNGLRHLQFQLEEWVQFVRNLVYSHDGEILYVDVLTKDSTRELLLYRRANYHWYLKTCIKLEEEDRYLVFKERRNKLFVIGARGFESFEFSIKPNDWEWKLNQEERKDPSCLHYSVDNNRLLVTDYSKSVIPPPFCLKEIKTDSRVVSTSILHNSILVITTSSICLYDYNKDTLTPICPNTITQRLCNTRLVSTSPPTFVIHETQYSFSNNKLELSQNTTPPPKRSITIKEEQIEVQQNNSQLFINGILLSEETTSFCLYDVFLLFTVTTSDLYEKLYVFNLEIDDRVYTNPSPTLLKTIEPNSLNVRNIERGSKIISCSLGRCIFQLPRGNLETIYPKIITQYSVKLLIEANNYLKAFEIIRSHKLDMNLLFDLDPAQFMVKTGAILSSIGKADHVSLVVAGLKEGVSEEVKYCVSKDELQRIEEYFEVNVKRKVKVVCEAISSSLREIGYQQYILAIVASEVKRGELAGILHEIKSIKEKDVVVKVAPHLTQEPKQKKTLTSKEILEYVCWMADPEVVYKTAFLTFDLQLVSMSAQFTQKDPKEYIPYLQELKAIPDEIDRRARICLDLKQYPEAVRQLSKGKKEQRERAVEIARQHHLYRVGIEAFASDQEYLLRVRSLLGEYLESKEELNEAYNVYLTSGMMEKALQLAQRNSSVKETLEIMRHLKFSHEEITKSMKEVVAKLSDSPGDGKGLGKAYQELGQYEEAARIYLKTQNFKRLNKILKHLPASIVSSVIQDGHKLLYSLKYNQTVSQSKSFTEKYARLQTIQKIKRTTGTLVIATKEGDEMYSEYSHASSQSRSNYTVSTTTGIKKKKQKVKGILTRNVKEGSPMQQEYLVAVLNDQSVKALDTIKCNKTVIQQLIYMNLLSEAQSLRNETQSYSEIVSKRVRMLKEMKYEEEHEEVLGVYPPHQYKVADPVSSFDYII